jgi:hypothetical protein
VQVAPVDAEVGHAVLARQVADRPQRQQLAVLRAVLGPLDRRADRPRLLDQVELAQCAHRVRPQVEAAADLHARQVGRPLVQAHIDPGALQRPRAGQAADPAADHDHAVGHCSGHHAS